MSACLVCFNAPIPAGHVMCRSCFQEHDRIIREVQAEPIPPDVLRQKLWGQQFERNRTPANRARIAYAAHLLASEGDDEMLVDVRAAFTGERASPPSRDKQPPPRERREPTQGKRESTSPLSAEARAVSSLEEALGTRNAKRALQPGEYKTKDGHWVRSKSEREIANFLFDNRIWYQYERPVTIADVNITPDFFLPDVPGVPGGLYLEHFGLLEDKRYRDLAERKASLFKQANLTLVATSESDAVDLDLALQRKLGKYFPKLNH